MSKAIKLADYLFRRLKELDIESIHGVPGDYNLTLLDYVEPNGLTWVGSANELNAGYAADGYARIKGVGALITTFGVGELSAINAIAGAYTERAAVVHIVGTPARDSQDDRLMVHHTLGDGDYRHFARMHSHVVATQVNLLDPRTAANQIDTALQQCILQSRPVYIEVPVDMVEAELPEDSLNAKITIPDALSGGLEDEVVSVILDKIYTAKQPVVLIDGEARGLRLTQEVQQLIAKTEWPALTTAFGCGLIDMTLPTVHGIYTGRYAHPNVKKLVDDADLVLSFGPHSSTTNTYFMSTVPKQDVTVTFTFSGIKTSDKLYRNISPKQVLARVVHDIDVGAIQKRSTPPDTSDVQTTSFSDVDANQELKQDKTWKLLASFLRPGDILLGETGTAAYAVREMPLPKHARLFTSVTWLSIGYALPAAQGAALAQRELINASNYYDIKDARTVLFIGDGSFQMTAQELATIIRHNLNVVLFLVNNDGYTIERVIHGLRQGYNDVPRWRYLKAPALFGGSENTYTAQVKTYGELQNLTQDQKLSDGQGLRMVEIVMEREDVAPGPLIDLLHMQMKREKGKTPTQP